ncbi:MAG TPA: hypothetical protein VH024_00305 [Candidatus Angelobacter sp.]|nr:hypothetical protein [Candidatus Angelobacter sp.]
MSSPANHILSSKSAALKRAQSTRDLLGASADSEAGRPFNVTPAPFPNFPAPGAAATTIISYQVPKGFRAKVTRMAISSWGGQVYDGTGNVVWRVLVNGAAEKGMENMMSQFGTDSNPIPVTISLNENDIISVTVEVPAGQIAIAGNQTTSARLIGYAVPLSKGVQQ